MNQFKMVYFKSLLLLAVVGFAAAESEYDWESFKVTHAKFYQTKHEETYRKAVFAQNVKKIKKHNQMFMSGLETYSMAVNHLADKLHSEVIGGGYLASDVDRTNEQTMEVQSSVNIPEEVDWRKEEGVVSVVKNQGQCGSCWAFSTTGGLEGQLKLKQNKIASLSESQLVDCSKENDGCDGGLMRTAFEYVAYNGIETEEDYPYFPLDGACKYDESKTVGKFTGYARIPAGNEEALTNAIATVGPISIAINANGNFMYYDSGIFVDPSCSPEGLNHGVLAVGYGHCSKKNLDFFIVKNSWGASWGEHGYIRMARNKHNQCGVASDAAYPTSD